MGNGNRIDWRLPGVIALLLLGALGIAACGSSGEGGTSGGTEGKGVTLIAGDKGDEFYITMSCGAETVAKKDGMTLGFQEPAQFTPAQQTPIVNAVAAKSPAAVLIAPTDAKAMYAPIKQLAETGSKVIMVDTTLEDPSMAASQVSTDDVQGGKLAAQEMAKSIGGKGKVIVINLSPGVSTTDARAEGFMEEAEKLGLEPLPQQYAGESPEKAASIVQATLAANPDLAGIFATTNFGEEGAVTGLQAQEKVGEVDVIGFDSAPVQVKQLEEGSVQALIAQQARKIGELGVEQAVKSINGEKTEEDIEVPAVLVTKSNLSEPKVQDALQVEKCG